MYILFSQIFIAFYYIYTIISSLRSYTLSHASVYDIPRPLREDVQSKSARKSSAGGQVKLEEEMYNLKTSIDFDTCSDRVALLQTGAANLTNVTSSSFRDAATRYEYYTYKSLVCTVCYI